MPSSTVRIDPAGPVVLVQPSGTLSLEIVEGLLGEIASLPGSERGMPRVWDLSDADLSSVEASLVSVLAKRITEQVPDGQPTRIAIVAPDDLAFGLSRVYGAHRGESTVTYAVFREAAAAMAWAIGQGAESL